jgi:5-methylcytosine-specific restriction endonuclease McrA
MACDGRVQVGERTSRTIPANLRRAVEVRDHGMCVFPGCESKAYLDCHHIVAVAQQGPTVLDNLVLLCWDHHQLVHEHHWSLTGEAGPNITWIRPTGEIFEPRVRVSLDTS